MSDKMSFPIVDPNAVLMVPDLRPFGLTLRQLRKEMREGTIRVAKRGKRYYVLGRWLLEWIASGEIHKTPTPEPAAHDQLYRPGGPAGPLTNGKHARGEK